MIKIKKEYPLQYQLICEECQKTTFLNKPYYKKFGWKHECPKKVVDKVVQKVVFVDDPQIISTISELAEGDVIVDYSVPNEPLMQIGEVEAEVGDEIIKLKNGKIKVKKNK